MLIFPHVIMPLKLCAVETVCLKGMWGGGEGGN